MRFLAYREAELAIQMAEGRSWGGRRIKVNLARSQASNSDGTLAAAKVPPPGVPAGVIGVNAWAMKSRLALKEPAGWIVEVGEGRGVRLASWGVAAEKQHLVRSLVGFLKNGWTSLKEVEAWLLGVRGQ